MQNLLQVESVGHGNYRHIYCGWTGKEIAKIKECDNTGCEVTTYLYDGSNELYMADYNGDAAAVFHKGEESGFPWYEPLYKNEIGPYYREQVKNHKEN